jgi:hypothetical protein
MPESPPSSVSSPVFILRPHLHGNTLARWCRDAWRAFVEQSPAWRAEDLVLWTRSYYAPIAQEAAYAAAPGLEPQAISDYSEVNGRIAEQMIATSHQKTVEILRSFSRPRARATFSRAVRRAGVLTHCLDDEGNTVHLPSPISNALMDRVLGLIAADLGMRPDDFASGALCEQCSGVAVGEARCCGGATQQGRDRPWETERMRQLRVGNGR